MQTRPNKARRQALGADEADEDAPMAAHPLDLLHVAFD